jgi:hypothetical protein
MKGIKLNDYDNTLVNNLLGAQSTRYKNLTVLFGISSKKQMHSNTSSNRLIMENQ